MVDLIAIKNVRIPRLKSIKEGIPKNPEYMHGDNHLINRLYVHWDITTVCNFKCSYCYARRDYLPKNQWMKTSDFTKMKLVIKSLEKSTLPVFLGLLGGEPTLHPKFYEILEILNEDFINKYQDNRIYVTSNLSTDKFKDIPIYKNNKYLCSLHFEYKSIYGENFEKFFENLEILLNKNYQTRVNFLLLPDSKYWDDIHKVYEKLKSYKIVEVHPHFLYYDPCDKTSLFDYTEDFYNEFRYMNDNKDFVYKEGDNYHMLSDIEIFENHLNRFKGWECYNNNYEISWDGKVTNICKTEYTDLSNNPLFFKNIKDIKPMICPYKECNCDGLLKIYKKRIK